MLDDFYRLIYSEFDEDKIEKVKFERLASFLTNTYNLPFAASKKIVIDHSNKNDHTLSKYEYEVMVAKLYNVDKKMLSNRIEIFKRCDLNKDGYINRKELPRLFNIVEFSDPEFQDLIGMISVAYCMTNYDANYDNKLNFLDFHQYLEDTRFFHSV